MCLFKHKEMALVVLYVDDLLISAEDDTIIEAIFRYERSFVCVCLPEGVCGRGRLAESSRAPAI